MLFCTSGMAWTNLYKLINLVLFIIESDESKDRRREFAPILLEYTVFVNAAYLHTKTEFETIEYFARIMITTKMYFYRKELSFILYTCV